MPDPLATDSGELIATMLVGHSFGGLISLETFPTLDYFGIDQKDPQEIAAYVAAFFQG